MKCLPTTHIPLCAGLVLHDSHAEILSIRAFNSFLTHECLRSLSPSYVSRYICRRPLSAISLAHPQPFSIRPDVKLHFYSSEAPCGDASMELIMASQEDATPWPVPAANEELLRGRGYFSQLGMVRSKPGRADSPPTSCKSCSDKLSLRTCVSLLLTPTSYIISPENAYISSMTLPESQYSSTAFERAFSAQGRMKGVVSKAESWGGGYRFHPFRVQTTATEFAFSKRKAGNAGSNLSAVFVKGVGDETLIGGVLQGRKQFSGVRAGSRVCKMNLWKAVLEAATAVGVRGVNVPVYGRLKTQEERERVKRDVRDVLGGWQRSEGDAFEMVESDSDSKK